MRDFPKSYYNELIMKHDDTDLFVAALNSLRGLIDRHQRVGPNVAKLLSEDRKILNQCFNNLSASTLASIQAFDRLLIKLEHTISTPQAASLLLSSDSPALREWLLKEKFVRDDVISFVVDKRVFDWLREQGVPLACFSNETLLLHNMDEHADLERIVWIPFYIDCGLPRIRELMCKLPRWLGRIYLIRHFLRHNDRATVLQLWALPSLHAQWTSEMQSYAFAGWEKVPLPTLTWFWELCSPEYRHLYRELHLIVDDVETCQWLEKMGCKHVETTNKDDYILWKMKRGLLDRSVSSNGLSQAARDTLTANGHALDPYIRNVHH